MEAKPVEISHYYLSHNEKWVPFEVMRMRYEEVFSDLTEEEVLSFRKYQARWFYKEKTEKNQVAAHKSESDAGIYEEYVALLEEKTKVLVLKKPKKEKVVLTEIQKVQQFNEQNVGIKNTHRLYFSMIEQKQIGEFAYLLLDEKGIMIKEERIKEVIQKQNKERYIFQVMLHVLKITQTLGIKKLIVHTHHTNHKAFLSKMNQQQPSKKIKKMKNQYSDMCGLSQQFDYFQYKYIKKQKNKETVMLLNNSTLQTQNSQYVAHVDASVDYTKKEAYIAGVLKTLQGETTLSYAKQVAYTENTTKLEICAITEMMKQATQKGNTPVVIHTDNKSANEFFHALIKKRNKNKAFYDVIEKARKEYPDCTVLKVHRSKNKEAHRLSRSMKKALV